MGTFAATASSSFPAIVGFSPENVILWVQMLMKTYMGLLFGWMQENTEFTIAWVFVIVIVSFAILGLQFMRH